MSERNGQKSFLKMEPAGPAFWYDFVSNVSVIGQGLTLALAGAKIN